MDYISKINLGGTEYTLNPTIPFGDCSTAGDTEIKTVTVSPAITSLSNGQIIAVRFAYTNTASNPKLNVNGLGALKMVSQWGDNATVGTNRALSWAGGQTVLLRYFTDGTNMYWQKLTQSYQNFATTSIGGLMSSTDKAKLDSIAVSQKTVSSYLPSNVWNEAYHSITQYGKMVIVNISGSLNTAPSAALTLFNNLPAANGTAYGTVCTQDTGIGGPVFITSGNTYISTRGTVWISTIKTGYVYGQIIYFTT